MSDSFEAAMDFPHAHSISVAKMHITLISLVTHGMP